VPLKGYLQVPSIQMLKIFVFAFLISVLGCGTQFSSKGPVEKAIGTKIAETCAASQTCTVRIDEVTWFDWDNVIAFSGGFTYVDKNHILGKDYFKDSQYGLSNTLVFFKDGEIIYAEENYRDIEGYHNGDIEFSDMDSSKRYRKYLSGSVFEVTRNGLKDGSYYSLSCKACDE
jgi:hypothetical protein